jgi:Zn-dependent peptidase ImmA (M78 family)
MATSIIDQFTHVFDLRAADYFMYDPTHHRVFYDSTRVDTDRGRMMLLHEIGHALLGHEKVGDDQRYQMERDAWDVARLIGAKLGIRRQELLISRSLREVHRLGY